VDIYLKCNPSDAGASGTWMQDNKTSRVFADLKTQNMSLFAKSPRCDALHQIDNTAPSSSFQSLVMDIPRRHASILVQLRTGHVPLNKYLHRIKRADSPLCPACEGGTESVLHFLVTCPAYEPFRRPLHQALKRHSRSLNVLLNDSAALRPLFQFINRTGRFRATFGDVELPPSKEQQAG
jgi:hypothetical protein